MKDYRYYLYVLNDRQTPKCFEMAALGSYETIIQQFRAMTVGSPIPVCIILPKPFRDFLPPIIHTRDIAKLCMEVIDDDQNNKTAIEVVPNDYNPYND